MKYISNNLISSYTLASTYSSTSRVYIFLVKEICLKESTKLFLHYGTLDYLYFSMLIPVQTVAEEGPSVFSLRDDKGHTPAHWACLGGHSIILRFILDNKGPVDEASHNDLGARPIHWACVNGHVAIVDILLQAGVSIDVVDNKGCTPLIVAAQYGHTMLAGYLMGKGARLQIVDRDGDNALHWAAFKGTLYII